MRQQRRRERPRSPGISRTSGPRRRRRSAEAFTARYPGIKVNVFNSTAAIAFQRLTQDLKAGAPQADVFGTTDISHMPALKSQGALEKFVPETVAGMVPSVKALNDPDGFYTITYASLTALTYNRDKVKPENVPKHWTDLIDPKWMGQVTIGSPNYSGTLGGWSVMINRLYGMDFFDKLAANKPLVGRSIDDALIHLNSGESSIAAGDVASTSRSIARGNPLGISYPRGRRFAARRPDSADQGIAASQRRQALHQLPAYAGCRQSDRR